MMGNHQNLIPGCFDTMCRQFTRPFPCARVASAAVDSHVSLQLKTDKAQEIKKLNQQIQMVQSDMSKHREALEDCLRSDKL